MDLENWSQVFLTGCAGGLATEVLHWWSIFRTKADYPAYASSVVYWIMTALLVLFGGVVCLLQFGGSGSAWVIFQIGLASPLLLQKLSVQIPNAGGAMGSKHGWRDFFRW